MPKYIFTCEQRKRGGLNLVKSKGVDHMRAIGKAGAKTFWKRYTVKPAGTSGWVILRRSDSSVVNFIGSLPGRK